MTANPLREALEPCPFCGRSKAFVERNDLTSAFVQCDCGAQGPAECQDGDDEETPGFDAAVRAWNARAARAALASEPVAGTDANEIQKSDRGVESQTRKELSADAQSLIAAGTVDSLGVAPGRSETLSAPPAPAGREALAAMLAGFDGNRMFELTDHNQAIYFKRADQILSAIPPQGRGAFVRTGVFPYQQTFEAIGAAVTWMPEKSFGISVRKFQEAFNSHRDAGTFDQSIATPTPGAEQTAAIDGQLGIVLSVLRMLEEATGETFDDDGGDIAAIEREHRERMEAPPAPGAADRAAVIEECAKVAEGTAPIAAGNFFAARRDQCAKISAAIRALAPKGAA
jgi:hypothetical protein